jgi:hypothetical protein
MSNVNIHLSDRLFSAQIVLWRAYYVEEFLKREANDKKVKRTNSSIKSTLAAIESDRPRDGVRRDQPRQTHRTPSARTLRRWLAMYEAAGFDPLALRTLAAATANSLHGKYTTAEPLTLPDTATALDRRDNHHG